jgi:hypothetical protein
MIEVSERGKRQSFCWPRPPGLPGGGSALVAAALAPPGLAVAGGVAGPLAAVLAALEGPSREGGMAFPSLVRITWISRRWPSTSSTTWKLSPGLPVSSTAPSRRLWGLPWTVTEAWGGETGRRTTRSETGITVGAVAVGCLSAETGRGCTAARVSWGCGLRSIQAAPRMAATTAPTAAARGAREGLGGIEGGRTSRVLSAVAPGMDERRE